MASSMGRDGRRRRVLNDEVRSASGLSVSTYETSAAADAPRYGEQANVEHHPQVTDYVPRRKRTMIVALLAGLATAAASQALIHFAEPMAAAIPGIAASDLVERVAEGVAAWASAVALLLVAMLAKLIYSLRRHRVDDYAGRYRVWRWIAWGGVLASINSVIHLETIVARMAVAATGMSLTSIGSEWWLAPLALVGGWIFVRLMLEVGESRSSFFALLLAAGCYGVAAAGALGFSLSPLGAWSSALIGAAPLAGHTIALVALMIFARYVVLDVQGLIDHAPRPVREKTPKKAAAPATSVKLSPGTVASPASASSAARTAPDAKASAATQNSAQVTEAFSDDEDDDDLQGVGRKLTKAERKRLRKQQRAA